LDTWSIQDLSNRRDRGNHGSFTYQTTSTKTCRQITALYNVSPTNHIIWTFMNSSFGPPYNWHSSFLDSFTKWQRANIKGHLVNSNNRSHILFSFFSLTYLKLSPSFKIIDNFSDRFSFNFYNKEINDKFCFH